VIFSSDGIMARWEKKMYPSIDFERFLGYPNYFDISWGRNCPKFDGDPSLAITHVVEFLEVYLRYKLDT
jgi:hypothetical protein